MREYTVNEILSHDGKKVRLNTGREIFEGILNLKKEPNVCYVEHSNRIDHNETEFQTSRWTHVNDAARVGVKLYGLELINE